MKNSLREGVLGQITLPALTLYPRPTQVQFTRKSKESAVQATCVKNCKDNFQYTQFNNRDY